VATGPRYQNAVELIRTATALQGTSYGLTVGQLVERFGVSRKTVERRLKAIEETFPAMLVSETREEDGMKHWRLKSGLNAGLVGAEAVELAALDTAIELVEREGRPDQAQALRGLAEKVRALRTGSRAAVETDAEALLEGEGIATRPGPRPKIDLDVVSVLRDGLLACLKVRIRYRGRIKGDETWRVVHPYGFLFGGRHYLIAQDADARELRMFSLSNVLSAELLDGSYFERPEDFDLKQYASRSFGVFQTEPVDVVWRFGPGVADSAAEYLFHPSQTLEREDDGTLVVRFRASGLWEMAWHAFEWSGDLEIVEPPELRETLLQMVDDTLKVYRG